MTSFWPIWFPLKVGDTFAEADRFICFANGWIKRVVSKVQCFLNSLMIFDALFLLFLDDRCKRVIFSSLFVYNLLFYFVKNLYLLFKIKIALFYHSFTEL